MSEVYDVSCLTVISIFNSVIMTFNYNNQKLKSFTQFLHVEKVINYKQLFKIANRKLEKGFDLMVDSIETCLFYLLHTRERARLWFSSFFVLHSALIF